MPKVEAFAFQKCATPLGAA